MRFSGFDYNWKKTTFGEIAFYKKGPFGSSLKKELFVPKGENTVKVYEQQNAINKNWKLARYYVTKEYAEQLSSFFVSEGDIIVSCAGTIGELYELPIGAEKGIINQALMRIRVKKEIDKDWFKYSFIKMIDEFSSKYSNGSAIKNIPPFSDLKPYPIFIPSTKEQNKIAGFLALIDSRIKTQNKIIKKYESLMNPIIEKLMRGFKCNQYRLKDISQIKKGEQIGNTLLSSGGAYPMLNGGISFSGNYTHFNRESNTIAISEGGNSCGYVSFIDKEFWAGGHCYTIHPKRKDPVFNRCLFYVLKKQENKIMTLRVGSGLPNIQKKDLENLLIDLPESSCISKFSTILGTIEAKIKIEKVIFSKLMLLKRYLLANMFI